MSEPELQKVLRGYAATEEAPDQLADIQRGLRRRKSRRRWIRGSIAAFLLCFAFATFAPVGGNALAMVRKEIQPTLFLKTTLGEAKRTIRESLTLPATYRHFTGEDLPLTDDAQALVGRWLSYEMVAVAVTSEADAMGVISFDLRRTTYKPEPNEEWWTQPPDTTARNVKVGQADGVVFLESGQEKAFSIRWKTETHTYRLIVGRPMTPDELAAYAAQIQ